jgi:DNA primase
MAIDFDAFIDWAEGRFYDVVVSGNEVQVNSIFKETDQDHKMWCRPDLYDFGVYHCWKSEKSGTLVDLVMRVDHCDFQTAIEVLKGEEPLEYLYEEVVKLFAKEEEEEKKEIEVTLELPTNSYPIADLPTWNPNRKKAEEYLKSRKISTEKLYVCLKGRYYDRIVIPYYDREGHLIYFNCRTLNDAIPKYMGPPKELGIGKGDVIYMPAWPPTRAKLYLTEGELDAISLYQCGLFSAALGGKSLSSHQFKIVRNYTPVISVDNDEAGRQALTKIGEALLGNVSVSYVRPPKGFKDWNAFLGKFDTELVLEYLNKFEKPYTEDTI